MKRVLVITNNLNQASFRLRVAALVGPLRERGFELVVRVRPRGWLARWRLLAGAGEFDAVLLQRKLLDPSDARLLRRSARRVLFDVDDAVMIDQKPRGWFARWRLARRFEATAGIVDCAVVGNEYLAGIFAKRAREVVVLPTVVDMAHYQAKEHAPTDQPRLVWIGSHSTLPYLSERLAAIEAAGRQAPGLRLLIIADQTLKGASIPLEHASWSEQTEAELLCRGDIGIAPTPLNPWTLGKCGFKIVQYMAAGLPVIASPVGANSQIVQDGQSGILADGPDEWTEAIVKLARDPVLRRSMGAAGRRRVAESYTLARAIDAWARVLSA